MIKSSAVTNSVAILLGDGNVSVSDAISQHVQTTCSDDYTVIEKQIIQIMQGLFARAILDSRYRKNNIALVSISYGRFI